MSEMTRDTALVRFLAASHTKAQLRELRAEARAEVESLRSRVAVAEDDLARIEQALLEKSGGRGQIRSQMSDADANGAGVGPRPTMKEAILAAMASRPGELWSSMDILDALTSVGAAPGGKKPLNTLTNRLLEMTRDRLIHKHGRGTYSLTPPAQLIPNEEEVPPV